MLTFVSFIIVMIGSLNWFFIAAFQYDFIAGVFGTQASLLSRLAYFIIGMASFVLIAMTIKSRGKLKVTENSFKQQIKSFKKKRETDDKTEEKDDKMPDDNDKNPKNELHRQKQTDNSETNSKQLKDDSNEPEKTKEVPYGYKDFDVTQYDD